MESQKADGSERRQHERFPARIEVRFKQREEAARAFRAFSLNLSVGGLCLKTDRKYELGSTMMLSLQIEGQEHQLVGVVSWARKGAIGIRFDVGSDEDRDRIQKLVATVRSNT